MNRFITLVSSLAIATSCSASNQADQQDAKPTVSSCATASKRLTERLEFLDEKIELAQQVSAEQAKGVLSRSTVERESRILTAYEADRRVACASEHQPGFDLQIASTLIRLADAIKRSQP